MAPGFIAGLVLLVAGFIANALPDDYLGEALPLHYVGKGLMGFGVLAILFAAWTVYSRTHTSHRDSIDTNARANTSTYVDNDERY